jgi:hypothetical protein
MNDALLIKDKLDKLYSEVLNGKQDIFGESDKIMVDILKLKDMSIIDKDEQEFVDGLIHSFVDKINLMYEILDVKKDNLLTLEHLEEEFHKLEIKRFNIENSYIMGMIKAEDINLFAEELFQFRNMLYAIQISDINLLPIAKMKSKIQHFNTEILEDEDILRVAYENSN